MRAVLLQRNALKKLAITGRTKTAPLFVVHHGSATALRCYGRKRPSQQEGDMRKLNYGLKQLCERHREGSHGTQDQRQRHLSGAADKLHELGFRRIQSPENLKQKHVYALVSHWQSNGLSSSTIKNRMASLRWLGKVTNNSSLVNRDNDHYGIEKRSFSTNENKALEFRPDQVSAIADQHVKFSARLQAAFGLRREEAMKFSPSYADKGDKISLKASWTKGGRARDIPVRTEEQRQLLNEARNFAGSGSMIPAHKSYVQHLKVFEKHMDLVGLGRTHGARHFYAQDRYQKLTGWDAPAVGGPKRSELSEAQRQIDYDARQEISRELGHERVSITVVYLGR